VYKRQFEDNGIRLPDLVRLIYREVPSIKRIRLSSLEPQEVDRGIIELFDEIPNLCPHIHLVAQSGSNRVLRDMKRRYTREEYLSLVEGFRSVRNDIEFTTDIIVGFPSEDERDFEDTITLVKEVEFIKVHIFPFSPRPGTEAFNLRQIDKRVVREREARLRDVSLDVACNRLRRLVGENLEILVERSSGGIATGLTTTYIRVYSTISSPVPAGSLLDVHIEGLDKRRDSIVLKGTS